MEWALLMATLGLSFLLAPLSFESPVACLTFEFGKKIGILT